MTAKLLLAALVAHMLVHVMVLVLHILFKNCMWLSAWKWEEHVSVRPKLNKSNKQTTPNPQKTKKGGMIRERMRTAVEGTKSHLRWERGAWRRRAGKLHVEKKQQTRHGRQEGNDGTRRLRAEREELGRRARKPDNPDIAKIPKAGFP